MIVSQSVQSKNVADTISRTAFDYDLSHDTEQDIPTTVSRSKKVSACVRTLRCGQ